MTYVVAKLKDGLYLGIYFNETSDLSASKPIG